MREVQATEAKAHLAQLLSLVERGESITITRHGKPIAHLVPAQTEQAARNRAAVAEFRTRRSRWAPVVIPLEEILAARHEGHRM